MISSSLETLAGLASTGAAIVRRRGKAEDTKVERRRSCAVPVPDPRERMTNSPPPLAARADAIHLSAELDRFAGELRAAGLKEATVQQYLVGSSLFVRWLADDYTPGGRRAARR